MLRVLIVLISALLVSTEALAGCCRLIKVDPETPATTIRVCEPGTGGGCSALFEGALELGQAEAVCVAGAVVVYEEWDAEISAFGPPTEAICDGGDVEI